VPVCVYVAFDPRPGEEAAAMADELFRRYGAAQQRFDDLDEEARKSVTGILTADALTAMRDRMAADCDARVLIAGRIHGGAGWLPGIAEEVLTTVRAGKPLLLLGRFGGCSKLLADWLLEPAAPWPAALTYDGELAWRRRKGGQASWLQGGTDEPARRARYEVLERELAGSKALLHDAAGPPPRSAAAVGVAAGERGHQCDARHRPHPERAHDAVAVRARPYSSSSARLRGVWTLNRSL
jgi:hypothetical protein